jgi:glycosyltransferase involved in cell wall biosynthesis
MSQPAVSVVMAVCNVERFLGEAIDSILGQTFRDFEFIIVDFGSTDNSRSIAAKYAARDSRIRLHEIPNCPLPEARNAGSFLSQGRYVAVMDADDISLPERLQLEVMFMETHPEVGLMGGAVEWVDATGQSLGSHKYPAEDEEIRSILINGCPFWHPTVLVRREAFVTVGGYRAAFVFAHDYDLELRIAEHFKCANLKQVVLKYRIHPTQVTFRKQGLQTLCKLAAQASAYSRKENISDPLNGVQEITPALLTRLGVSEAVQQNALASDCRNWIRSMSIAREYSPALNAALGMLRSDLPHLEQWQIADLYLTVARLYWRQKRMLSSFLAVIHAVMARPAVAGRPLKLLLHRLGLA